MARCRTGAYPCMHTRLGVRAWEQWVVAYSLSLRALGQWPVARARPRAITPVAGGRDNSVSPHLQGISRDLAAGGVDMKISQEEAKMNERRVDPLSDQEVQQYRQTGYLFAGTVLDKDTIEVLRRGLAELKQGPALDGTISMDLMKRDERTKDLAFDFLAFLWKTRAEFRKIAFDPLLARMAAQMLGTDKVVLLGDSAFVKPARTGGRLYWHQDAMAWPLDRPGGVSAWIALDDANRENGSMVFAAGSHLLGERLPVDSPTGETLYTTYVGGDRADGHKGNDLSTSGMLPVTSPEEEGLTEVETSYSPGDCSFHDSLLWHASGLNTSGSIRRAYGIRYVDGNRIWVGERKAFYYFRDEEAGVEVGAPIGGPNFPTVWAMDRDKSAA
jgi:phytanoyl-CoA hydroxylase